MEPETIGLGISQTPRIFLALQKDRNSFSYLHKTSHQNFILKWRRLR